MCKDSPTSLQFVAGEVTVVATAEQRRAVGLDHWVDGTMGFIRYAGRTVVVAPNGPRLARHIVEDEGDLLTGLRTSDVLIEGLPGGVEHASGGPLLYDEDSGMLLLVYHGETFRDGNYEDFYSFLGLAVSDDRGATFRDLGRIVTSDLRDDDPSRPTPVELGSGGFVMQDGWVMVYFHDRNSAGVRRNLSVARCSVQEVLAAASSGRSPEFLKYRAGGFTELGLGGRSDELLPGVRRAVCWHDVARIPELNKTLLVYSSAAWTAERQLEWNLLTALSSDGIVWTSPEPLFDEPIPGEMLYVTIDSTGPDQRSIEGDAFHLYRVRSTAPYRWDDACLERVTVRWR